MAFAAHCTAVQNLRENENFFNTFFSQMQVATFGDEENLITTLHHLTAGLEKVLDEFKHESNFNESPLSEESVDKASVRLFRSASIFKQAICR